jgi:hypothetical protein
MLEGNRAMAHVPVCLYLAAYWLTSPRRTAPAVKLA